MSSRPSQGLLAKVLDPAGLIRFAGITLDETHGLPFRPERQAVRMGVDSLDVHVPYAVGVVGLVTLQRGG